VRIDHVDPPSAAAAAQPAPARAAWPPRWLMLALGCGYLVALAVLLFAPGGTFLERLRALDGGICAQLPGHSFYPAGQQLPLCARNTGIYLGFSSTIGMLFFSGRLRASRLPPWPILAVLGGAVALLGIDGFNSFFLDLGLPHLYQPHNLLRLATGLGTGTAMAAMVVPVTNGLLWREDDPRPSFGSWNELVVMVPILLLVFLGVASTVGVLLYPIAIISTGGLILALSSVNVVFALGITNRLGRFTSWRQFFPLFTLAVACAVVELMALFMLKSFALSALAA
jgi:uncharacterized membrane protein